MCNAVKLGTRTERFNQEAAELPVLARDGSVRWIAWGGRFGAEAAEGLPPGPCARLESIKAGRWRRWSPRPVQIPAEQFSERSRADRCNYWFWIPEGYAIQGLYVPQGDAQDAGRVYVVTVDLPTAQPLIKEVFPAPALETIHDRWPRFVQIDKDTCR